jgi:hypothetical protein
MTVGIQRIPCVQFAANAALFRIGGITQSTCTFQACALGEGWQRHQAVSVRWRLFDLPGKLVCHCRLLAIEDHQREPRPDP